MSSSQEPPSSVNLSVTDGAANSPQETGETAAMDDEQDQTVTGENDTHDANDAAEDTVNNARDNRAPPDDAEAQAANDGSARAQADDWDA